MKLDRIAPSEEHRWVLHAIQAIITENQAKAYLVGGVIRDALLGRPCTDWDIAVEGDALSLAQACAERLNAKSVLLDQERLPTARLVRTSAPSFIDLASLRAPSIREDLRRRDLTLNAMALSLTELLEKGETTPIDPCGGLTDIQQRRIAATSEASLLADPLRLLRAYRFAATLEFQLDASTEETIREHHARLPRVAMERIRDEWCKLLDAPRATPVLRAMDEAGLLVEILPEIDQMKGVEQNVYHHLDVWQHTLLALDTFERQTIPEPLTDYRGRIRKYLRTRVVYDKRKRMLIKLALLMHDVAKPATRSVGRDGRVRFIGHEKIGSETAGEVCDRLRLGGKAKAVVKLLVRNHLRMMHFAKLEQPSERAIRRFIRHTGEDWLGVLLLSYADLQASQGPRRSEEDIQTTSAIMRAIADMYYTELEERIKQPRLISGHDLLAMNPEPPGRWVGQTLKRIEDMQFNGEIRTHEEALDAAKEHLRQLGFDVA